MNRLPMIPIKRYTKGCLRQSVKSLIFMPFFTKNVIRKITTWTLLGIKSFCTNTNALLNSREIKENGFDTEQSSKEARVKKQSNFLKSFYIKRVYPRHTVRDRPLLHSISVLLLGHQ